jgi:uncharacterized protein (DUF1810 family)
MSELSSVHDPFHLQRFVDAQADMFDQALAELHEGRKRSHWMWFIFPQIAGLGSSSMAQRFAISGREEALTYLSHPLLGPRLRQCADAVNRLSELAVDEIFGYPDDLKFHSSVTLFAAVAPDEQIFRRALDKYFGGEPDPATRARL